ncbi:MAG: hypothetical protein ACRDLF_11665 [Solirubrobacteraceae bacterium]
MGLAATIGAFAGFAAPAMASQFTASRLPKPISEAEPGKTTGIGIGSTELGGEERSQELKFGEFYIVCAAKTSGKTVNEGAVLWSTSQVFATEVKFEKCLTRTNFEGFIAGTKTSFNVNPETKKSEPVKFVYHVNGFVELGTGETESEVEVGSGTASFSIAGKVCKIEWPRQTVPAKAVQKPEAPYSAAVYSTKEVPVEPKQIKKFPSLFQKRLVIANEFKNMEWHYEEGQCLGEGGFEEGAKQQAGKTGVFKGSFEEQLSAGNLAFE